MEQRLAVVHSHPLWFVRRFIQERGEQETEALCEVNNRPAPMTVRINRLKATLDDVLEALQREGIEATASPHLIDAVHITNPKRDITATRPYREGWIQIQDEASQLIGYLVAPAPGARVLDLCAGFGGKSTHLGVLMRNHGQILSVDRSAWKLEDLKENARRQGIMVIETLARDAMDLRPDAMEPFDCVLLDAPCSGFGVLRRNPDIKWRRHPKDPYRLSQLQRQLLEHGAGFVRAGGVVVYATCTVFAEEDEQVVAGFLANHPDWVLEEAAPYLPGTGGQWTDGRFLRTWPHRHGMDGFFGARLRKPS